MPIYQVFIQGTDHYYTWNFEHAEIKGKEAGNGYEGEVFRLMFAGEVCPEKAPLYEHYASVNTDHMYTLDIVSIAVYI